MANGILGISDLSATTNTTVATSSADTVVNVSICNRNAAPVKVRLALAATGTPALTEWIEYDSLIPANTPLERTGLPIESGINVVAYSDTANVTVVVLNVEI